MVTDRIILDRGEGVRPRSARDQTLAHQALAHQAARAALLLPIALLALRADSYNVLLLPNWHHLWPQPVAAGSALVIK